MSRTPILVTIATSLVLASAAFAGPPSQLPLLTRDASGPVPNLVFTLDDSGSMRLGSMGRAGHQETYVPDGGGGFNLKCIYWDCYDIGYALEEDLDSEYTRGTTVSTRDGDLYSARWRSSAINTIYYNPTVLYRPWANGDGTSMPNANPAAAPLDPVDPLSATANLVGIQTVSDEFCYEHPTAAVPQGLCDNVVGEEYSPATYYVFNGGDDMNIADYTRIRVADLATFVAGDARADCPADVANPAQRLCTQTEEYQNFANWFTYYRNRYLMAIGATSLAFAPLGDTMRVGYG
ncbi:MAG: hypothetical protein WBD51_20070, partial [Burkholderiaceae bacterium]